MPPVIAPAKVEVCLTTFLNGSGHAEYTRKSQLTEDKSKCHKIRKACVDGNKLHTGKEYRGHSSAV